MLESLFNIEVLINVNCLSFNDIYQHNRYKTVHYTTRNIKKLMILDMQMNLILKH